MSDVNNLIRNGAPTLQLGSTRPWGFARLFWPSILATIFLVGLLLGRATAFDLSDVTEKSQVAAIAMAREAHNAALPDVMSEEKRDEKGAVTEATVAIDPKPGIIATDQEYLDYRIRSMLTNLAQQMGTDIDYDAAILVLQEKRDAMQARTKR